MFNFSKKSKRPENLGEMAYYIEKLEKKVDDAVKELERVKKESSFSIRKVGVLRYNPFTKVGSDQSFSVALLDGNDDGVIISSLFTSEGNRIYAKPIRKGVSEYNLSEEEKKAIDKAMGIK